MRTLRTLRRIFVCTAAAGLVFPSASAGQDARPPADPADVGSVDAIIHALYDVISGPAGERDWERFESLFMMGARLIPTGVTRDGRRTSRVLTPTEYSRNNGPFFLENPFFETEIGRRREAFGNIIHVFSAYQSKRAPDQEPFSRGINSIQVMNDGERFWIATIMWDSERQGNVIPAQYVGGMH